MALLRLKLGLFLNAARGIAAAFPIVNYYLLKEDGDNLLLESGDRIIL